jgi:glycogen synthase
METGFLFGGEAYEAKIEDMERVFNQVVTMFFEDQKQWQKIRKAAEKERFTWKAAVAEYYTELYRLP